MIHNTPHLSVNATPVIRNGSDMTDSGLSTVPFDDESPSPLIDSFESPFPFYLPVGLKNLRNTCYFNSIVQSLYSIKLYSHSLLNNGWKFQKNSIGTELKKVFYELYQKTLHSDPLQNHTDSKLSYLQSIVNPLPLINALKINIYEQEDAEELLLNLINKVDESLGTSSSLASQTNGKASKSSVKSIPPPSNEPVLLPSDVFQCQLNQFIYAMDHDHYLSSNKTLKYFDLSISIDNQQIINHGKMKNHQNSLPLIHLNDCIHNFFQPEYFIGNNQYKCNKYGYINAKKILKIISFPKILIIHLKRFSFDPNTYQMKKVTTPVEIPATLDLSQYAMKAQDFATVKEKVEEEEARKKGESTENEKVHTHSHSPEFFPNTISPTNNVGRYSLSAAVIHQGSIDRGHYFTLAKVAKHPNITDEDKLHHWVMLNDHQVTPLDEETVLKIARGEERSSSNGGSRSIYEKVLGSDPVSSNAYLLFYTLQE